MDSKYTDSKNQKGLGGKPRKVPDGIVSGPFVPDYLGFLCVLCASVAKLLAHRKPMLGLRSVGRAQLR